MSLRKFTIAISTTVASFTLLALPYNVQSQTISQNSTQQSYAGFAAEDEEKYFQPTKRISIFETLYTGTCPGTKIESPKVVFISDKTPTAPDRRVIITNITNEAKDLESLPYTDREYKQDQLSEDIKLTLGYEHKNRKFIVSEGENLFKYEIVQIEQAGEQEFETVLETGSFSATVEKLTEYEERNSYPQAQYDEDGKIIGYETVCPR